MGWVMAGGQATVQDPGSSPPSRGRGRGRRSDSFHHKESKKGRGAHTDRQDRGITKSDKMTPTHRNRDWGTDIQSEEKTKLLK